VLALSQLATMIGDGLYYVCAALYFTRIVGLRPGQFALGLTTAAMIALLGGIPWGHLADRRGPRGVAISLNLAAGAAVATFLFTRSLAMFVVVATVYAVCSRGAQAARQALLAGLVDRAEITQVRAYVISMLNVGLGIGAALGGLTLLADTRAGYLVAFGVDAASFVVAALLLTRLPAVPGARTRRSGRLGLAVLRDKPYILISVINMILVLHFTLMDVALPLWVADHTAAPRWMVAAIFVLNTAAVAAFQVRVARGVSGLGSAVRNVRSAGAFLLASCAVYAASAIGASAWVASALLVAAAALMVTGEMRQTVGTTEISFGLAPPGLYGQYQGLFGMGVTSAQALGPVLLTSLIVYGGSVGWLALGGLFALAGLAMGPAVRWAQRTGETLVLA
jgi:MFS family permease